MLGQALGRTARARGHHVVGAGRRNADVSFDITDDEGVREAVESVSPDVLVNCAALIDVARCNDDPLTAWRVNARAVGVMAEACRARGITFVQISTEHYFTGGGALAHDESAPVTFFNEYARTKFAGEGFAAVCPDHLVLRTNIVGFRGHEKPTFAEWAFRAVEEDAELILFHDSHVSSIDVDAFSRALLDLVDRDARGLFHLASSEVFSKQQLIEAIADALGVRLTRATSGSVHSLSVPRAESCGLDVSKAESVLGYALPDLREVVAHLATEWRTR